MPFSSEITSFVWRSVSSCISLYIFRCFSSRNLSTKINEADFPKLSNLLTCHAFLPLLNPQHKEPQFFQSPRTMRQSNDSLQGLEKIYFQMFLCFFPRTSNRILFIDYQRSDLQFRSLPFNHCCLMQVNRYHNNTHWDKYVAALVQFSFGGLHDTCPNYQLVLEAESVTKFIIMMGRERVLALCQQGVPWAGFRSSEVRSRELRSLASHNSIWRGIAS